MDELEAIRAENRILKLELENLEMRRKLNSEYRYGNAESKLITSGDNQRSMNLQNNRGFEEFKSGFVQRSQKRGLDIKGRTYDQILEELCYRRAP